MSDFIIDMIVIDPAYQVNDKAIQEALGRVGLCAIIINRDVILNADNISLPFNHQVLQLAEEIKNAEQSDY